MMKLKVEINGCEIASATAQCLDGRPDADPQMYMVHVREVAYPEFRVREMREQGLLKDHARQQSVWALVSRIAAFATRRETIPVGGDGFGECLSLVKNWLAEREGRTRQLPLGAEDRSRGSSVYNWRRSFELEFGDLVDKLTTIHAERGATSKDDDSRDPVGWRATSTVTLATPRTVWRTIKSAPPFIWLRTRRLGEAGESLALLNLWNDGADNIREWCAPDGRTTITHGTYAPPTHWATLLKVDEGKGAK